MSSSTRFPSIHAGSNEPCIWAEVDTDAPKESRIIEVFGTGHDIPMSMGVSRRYIGTFQVSETIMGTLVFHAYERLD